MYELTNNCLKDTKELLEKRFEEIEELTDRLFGLMERMKIEYLEEKQMQVYAMQFNNIVEELKEEYKLVLAICVVYEIKGMKDCLLK